MKRIINCLSVLAALSGILVFMASISYCAMTSGNLAISTSIVGGGGGLSTTNEGGTVYKLYSVCGQSTSIGTFEGGPRLLSAGYIFTLKGVTIEMTGAPTMEWVKVSGVKFKSGDIISSNSNVEVKLDDQDGVATIELQIDSSSPVGFALDDGTTFEGTWSRSMYIPDVGAHTLRFYACDSGGKGKYYDYLARIMGGSVQLVGRSYNFPNPFSPMAGGTTTIQYVLSTDATVTFIIYDVTGHEVKRMKFRSGAEGGRGGTNQAVWNGKSMGGEVVGNGMYIYKIISGDQVIGSGKLVVFE